MNKYKIKGLNVEVTEEEAQKIIDDIQRQKSEFSLPIRFDSVELSEPFFEKMKVIYNVKDFNKGCLYASYLRALATVNNAITEANYLSGLQSDRFYYPGYDYGNNEWDVTGDVIYERFTIFEGAVSKDICRSIIDDYSSELEIIKDYKTKQND